MAIENLKQNMEMMKNLVREMINFSSQLGMENASSYKLSEIDKKLLKDALSSAINRLKILNNATPELLNEISPFKKLEVKEEIPQKSEVIQISYQDSIPGKRISVAINKDEKDIFIKELNISRDTLKRLRGKGDIKKTIGFMEFKGPNWYTKISNKLFIDVSNYYLKKGALKNLNTDLRKSNINLLVTSYISIILFSTMLALIGGIIATSVLFALTKEFSFKIIMINLSPMIGMPILTFFILYFYPEIEKGEIEKRIEEELPFAVIHMSAIARSGIEPTQIFKIIALGEEYKNIRQEFRKIVNQVNIYGYDIITALKNTAMDTSSTRLSELLNGVATNISGGGQMTDFLDKRAETLMFDYKLNMEKKAKTAETFMDLYLSIVVAAPMILTFLLILISISGIGIGLSILQLTFIILGSVALINIVFLIFLGVGK